MLKTDTLPHILIVDDSPSAIDLLVSTLQGDYQFTIATHGRDALELLRSDFKPELILLDIMMPDMDGYEVCRHIKQNPATEQIPIIFLTATKDIKAESSGLALGAVDYIHKPFNPEIIKQRIHNHIERECLRRELQEQYATLEEQVKLRTESLRLAKEAAESASQFKSMVLRNLSHELRTPINAITGMNYLAKRYAKDPKLLRYIEKSETAAQNLLIIVDNLITLAELDQNRFTLSIAPFKVEDVILNCRKVATQSAQEKQLNFQVAITDLPSEWLIGDAKHLQLILHELIANAIKFSHEGLITLRVTHETLNTETVRLLFEVEDQGIGIAPEKQFQLFHPFHQLDASHTREYGGNGIGLALCAQLIEHMNGEIGVKSELGHGSLFWFSLPLQIQTETSQ